MVLVSLPALSDSDATILLISLMVLLAEDYTETLSILQWLVGGLAGRGWRHVFVIALPVLLGIFLIYRYSRDLNLFLLGEETAQGLGTNVPRSPALSRNGNSGETEKPGRPP